MVYLIILGLIFFVDYSIKRNVEKTRVEGQEEELFEGRIIVRRMSNYGAAGSLFSDKPRCVKIAGAALMGLVGIRFLVMLFQKGRLGMKLGYSLVLGGGLSNLTDRFTKGYVTDYISFNIGFKKLKNLVFNLSDLFIFLGCAILCLCSLRKHGKKEESS